VSLNELERLNDRRRAVADLSIVSSSIAISEDYYALRILSVSVARRRNDCKV